MTAHDDRLIRKYAQVRAQECIDDWATTDWAESNEIWDTDFSPEQLRAIADLAARCIATLPAEESA